MTYGDCDDCEMWRNPTDDATSGYLLGACCANTPVFVFGLPHGMWPMTFEYQGCGQHIPSAAAIAKAEHMKNGICAECGNKIPDCDCVPF